MKTQVKEIEECKKEISVEVPKDAVIEEFEKVFKHISKHSKIKGFRPGKAPRELVEMHYKDVAKKEVIDSLMPQYYQKAIEKEKISVASYPEISNVELKDNLLSFKAVLETKPSIKLKDYKNLKVKQEKVEIKDKDVDNALDNMKKAHEESVKDKKEGQKVAINDEFAKKLGCKDLKDLREKIKENLEHAAKQKAQQDEKNQIVDQLSAGVKFDVPKSWVHRQHSGIINNLKRNMIMSGVKQEDLDKKIKEREKDIDAQAEKNVRLFFIMEEIAKKEDIKISKEELQAHVKNLALQQGVDEGKIKDYLNKNNLWDDLVLELRHEKIMNFLLSQAKKKN